MDNRVAPSLEQELQLRLAAVRGQLSANDERIASFLGEHLHDLAFHTAESLAQGAGVSPAAVVRFARRLEFASFRELRNRARAELMEDSAEGGRPSTPSPLMRKTQKDISSLQLLSRLLEEPLPRAAELIAQARSTWFLANRETHALALYAYRLLHHSRPRVHLVDPSFPDPLRDLGPEDVVVVCTFRPYSTLTLSQLDYSRTVGARVVLVTDGLAHSFIDPDDIVLPVPVDSPTLFLSFTPAMCALETLASLVSMVDADQTFETLEATASFIDHQQLTLETEFFNPNRPGGRT